MNRTEPRQETEDVAPQYPWQLLPRLAMAIENRRSHDAHERLEKLLKILDKADAADLTVKKLRCAQIVSACLRAAHRAGASSEPLLDGHAAFLEAVATTDSSIELDRHSHEYLGSLLAAISDAHVTSSQRAVMWIQNDIRRNLDRPRTLDDYAIQFGISASHLSRTFTRLVGSSLRDERRRWRMETACTLLRTTDLKVRAVAARVGMADPSAFVSQFRNEIGVTPGVFRQQARGREAHSH